LKKLFKRLVTIQNRIREKKKNKKKLIFEKNRTLSTNSYISLTMSNFMNAAKDMRAAYLRCCADEKENMIFNLETRKLYRVSENGEIFYLKTIDSTGPLPWTPRKLWHRLESKYQPTESLHKGRLADELLNIRGSCICGTGDQLYYRIIPGKDEGNFEFYLWKTSDGWNGQETHSHFVPIKDYNVSSEGEFQHTMMEPTTFYPQEEWVSEFNMDLYRFSADTKIERDGLKTDTHAWMDMDVEQEANQDVWSMVMNDYESPESSPRTPTHTEQEQAAREASPVRRQLFTPDDDEDDYDANGSQGNSSEAIDWSESDSEYTDVGEEEDNDVDDVDGVQEDHSSESDDSDWLPEEGGDDQSSDDESVNDTNCEYGYEPEYRYDEWSQDWYTKEEFYYYYGNNSVWKMMHPKKVYRRSIMMFTADRINHWDPKNFRTFMKMVRDSY
jgi:hypothetical protein